MAMAARFLSALHARGRSLASAGITLEAAPSTEVSSTDFLEHRQLQAPEDPVDNPRLCAIQYARNNRLQKKHSNLVLEFSQPAFLVDPRGTTRILDVGCGTGDFTRDSLLPSRLPCKKIVGVDISPDMIQYANRYSAHEKIEYCLLDIEKDVTEFLNHYGHFDRVYSFYCLQWLKDQGDALKNIASLLSPGGQCLLVFPATHQPATLWHRLAKMDHWEKYSETLTKFISKCHYMSDKEQQLLHMSALLRAAQLSPSILVLPRLVTFDGWTEEDIIEMHMAIVPINSLITANERQQLLEDVTALVCEVHGPESDQSLFRTYIIMATKMKC